MVHKYPPFYGVYLLQSSQKVRSCYVGSTPNPFRRIRQHNGDLKAGGAWRTKNAKLRPWNMVLIVNGFPSKIAALKFEHALQHPGLTRLIHTKDVKRKLPQKSKSIGSHLAYVRLLVRCSYFRRMQLKVTFFRSHVYDEWVKNDYKIECLPPQFQVELNYPSDETTATASTVGNGDLDINNSGVSDYLAECKAAAQTNDLRCYITDKTLDPLKGNVAICNHCKTAFDLVELAEVFIDKEPTDQVPFESPSRHVIPLGGSCPKCQGKLEWSTIVKGALSMKQ